MNFFNHMVNNFKGHGFHSFKHGSADEKRKSLNNKGEKCDVKIATSENGTHSEGDEDATKSGPSETKHSAFNNIMRSTFKKTLTKTTNHVEKSHHMGTSLKCITNRYNRNTCPHKPTSPVASSQKEEKLPKKEMSKKVKSHQNETEIELSVHGVSENVTDNRYDNTEKKVIDSSVQSGMDSATNQWLHTVEADQKHSTIEIRSPNIPEDSSDVNQLISLIQEQYPVKRYQATDVTPSNASIVPLMDCSTLANGSNNYMVQASRLPVIA